MQTMLLSLAHILFEALEVSIKDDNANLVLHIFGIGCVMYMPVLKVILGLA
jgi:hypothetical protein